MDVGLILIAFCALIGAAACAIWFITNLIRKDKITMPLVTCAMCVCLFFSILYGDIANQNRDELVRQYRIVEELEVEKATLKDQINQKQKEINELQEEYKQFKEEASEFLALSEAERAAEIAKAETERIAAEEEARLAKEEAERIEAERVAEEEAKKRAEEEARLAEEAKGYETGITYEQIARTPDEYVGKKVKFTGEVVQVMEGALYHRIRLATRNGYDDIVYASYNKNLLESRILDGDNITIYGVCQGVESYTTILGATITLPSVNIDRIDFNQ